MPLLTDYCQYNFYSTCALVGNVIIKLNGPESKVVSMAVQNKDLPRFSIVPQSKQVSRLIRLLVAFCVILIVTLISVVWYYSDSHAAKLAQALSISENRASDALKALDLQKQELANLKRADFISRLANNKIQSVLAEKDEQIAGLKADLSFYELLVGSSGRRHGLTVHNAEFEAQSDGAWQYTVTLTQNINRGGITSGQMVLAVEGVRNGKLASLDWQALTQNQQPTGQKFSFRYFQQLQGNIMLPNDFKPMRVKVMVNGAFGKSESQFDWVLKDHSTAINQELTKSE